MTDKDLENVDELVLGDLGVGSTEGHGLLTNLRKVAGQLGFTLTQAQLVNDLEVGGFLDRRRAFLKFETPALYMLGGMPRQPEAMGQMRTRVLRKKGALDTYLGPHQDRQRIAPMNRVPVRMV